MDVFAPFIHWSFFALAVVLSIAGDLVKRLAIPGTTIAAPTRENGTATTVASATIATSATTETTAVITDATVNSWPLWRRIYYRTIPLHPVIAGGLIGLALDGIAPAVVADKAIARVLYYAVAGAFCTWVYAGVTQWAKRLGGPG